MTQTRSIEQFDPNDPDLLIDPYPMYKRYRDVEPVHWGRSANPVLPGSWYTFGYEVSALALVDARLKSNPGSVGMSEAVPEAYLPVAAVFQEILGALDSPKHTRVRSVVSKAFTPKRVTSLLPRIEEIARDLMSRALDGGSRFDFVSQFAFPLPITVIGEMLGIPAADRDQFRNWSATFAQAVDNPGDLEMAAQGARSAASMLDYFRTELDRRRVNPTDDLLNAMMVASNDDGEVISEFEVLAIAIEMVIAGHETTVTGLTKAIQGLLETGLYGDVVSGQKVLSDNAVEEILRWTAPAQRQRPRWVTEAMELGGRELQVGQPVVVMLGAANRDPDQFPQPDVLDLDRPASRHLTFGVGPHFCLGRMLAKFEIAVALRTSCELAPALRLVPQALSWRPNTIIPGPAELFVEASARAGA